MVALILLSSAGKSLARPSDALTGRLFTVDDHNEDKEMPLSDQNQELKEKPREPQEDGDGSTFDTNDHKLDASSSSRASRDNSKSCIAGYDHFTIGSKIIRVPICKQGCQANLTTATFPGGVSKIFAFDCY